MEMSRDNDQKGCVYNRKICVKLLRYNVDHPETSYAQVRLFGRKKEEETFQQIVYVNYRLDDFLYLLDVTNSVYDKVITNQPICNVLKKVIATIYSNHLLFLIESGRVETLEILETSFSSQKNWDCIMLNLKVFSQKNYAYSGRNSAIARSWKD